MVHALNGRKPLILVSVLVIALNILRCPELLVHPRFFAEEGATYFSGAFQQSFLANIFSAHFGYYTLYNQIATSLAAMAPLEFAPLVTTWLSFFVQIGISLYVLWGELPLLDTLFRRTVLALAIPLLAWPGHWLTVIGTQCWFGAGTFLLLLGANSSRLRSSYVLKGMYLGLAGLTGVISCFMAPAYLLRAAKEKSREYFAYAGMLLFCLGVHLAVLLQAVLTNSAEVSCRFVSNHLDSLLYKTIVYQFAVPFTGRGIFEQASVVAVGSGLKANLENIFGVNLLVYDLFMIPMAIGMMVMLITAIIIWQQRSRLDLQLIALSLLTVSVLSNICSAGLSGGPRYYFLPSLMLLTLFIGFWELKKIRVLTALTGCIILSTLLLNGYEYRSIMLKQAVKPDYPDWQTEVEQWRKFPAYEINIWPAPWKMMLSRQQAG